MVQNEARSIYGSEYGSRYGSRYVSILDVDVDLYPYIYNIHIIYVCVYIYMGWVCCGRGILRICGKFMAADVHFLYRHALVLLET